MRRAARPVAVGASVSALVGLLVACGASPAEREGGPAGAPLAPSSVSSSAPTRSPSSPPEPESAPAPDLDVALSEPVEDSLYPQVGDPGVDALHYDLDLAWSPDTDTLTATETLTFRSTATAEQFQLDFGAPLTIGSLTLDGDAATYAHRGKDLVVLAPVRQDQTYELVVDYTGTPEPVDTPTERSDIARTGFTIDRDHQVWTMQEPFGAYTWYAVNDHPSDKALYDFTLSVPAPWTGIANGAQVRDETSDGIRTTAYHLAEPAASYLVTLAFGDYQRTEDVGPRGLPVTYWTPQGREPSRGLRSSPEAIAWLEQYLGPYPFDTAGIVLVDSESGMETQTMITLGDTSYSTAATTVLHEFAHQWYGDQVTPSDWRDLWMNEGMAMYLQLMWDAEQVGTPVEEHLELYVDLEARNRRESGPPGDFDPEGFGNGNVYYGGALLWHSLREQVGDGAFFEAIRTWPQARDNTSTDRAALLAHLEQSTGEQLDAVWNAWLLDPTSPPFG